MTILSNLLLATPGYSGFNSYVRQVLPGIPGYRLVLGNLGRAECRQDDWVPVNLPDSKMLALLQRLSLTQHGLGVDRALQEASIPVDSIHAVYSPFSDFLFALGQVPQVITCHDLTPLFCGNSRKAAWKYRYLMPQHLKRAAQIIAVSRFVADQLVDFGIPSSKIEVVYNGISVQREPIKAPRSLDLLMLARHDRNKNVLAVVRSFARLLARKPEWPGRLIIVGKQGRQTPELFKFLASCPKLDKVILKSKVTEVELTDLIRGSLALVSASLMEGFDLPILEAKAEGLPTLISDIPVHREIHDQSSLFFSLAHDSDMLIEAILQLGQDHSLWKLISLSGVELARSLTLAKQQASICKLIERI